MKRQYLGDARDAFKWEYQDYLVRHLGYPALQIVPMLTDDDDSNDGKTHPSRFPADAVIHDFCMRLRQSHSFDHLNGLPGLTGADYRVIFHRVDEMFSHASRGKYFTCIVGATDQVVFVDPDTGFEPKWPNDTHVAYSDVEAILDQITRNSVVSVYQHQRQGEAYATTLEGIRYRLPAVRCAAIYGHQVMFISISRSRSVIESVASANKAYAAARKLNVA